MKRSQGCIVQSKKCSRQRDNISERRPVSKRDRSSCDWRGGRLSSHRSRSHGKELGVVHAQGPLSIWYFTLFWQVFCAVAPIGLLPYFRAEYESFKGRVVFCS